MNKTKRITKLLSIVALLISCSLGKLNAQIQTSSRQISGVYPHLAMYNNEGECGTGAVVPWAGKLWVITYGPHLPNGSSDKLYEVSPSLHQKVRSESIGGTPANRMIHNESNQLFIGPYAISGDGEVKAIPYSQMSGRHTGNARHLTDPVNKIYYGTMEEGFYDVDVNTLHSTTLYEDSNGPKEKGQFKDLLNGAHGKGLYSGQDVMVYSNNGEGTQLSKSNYDIESGVLAEWDGKNWKEVRRNQFVEVTGPGGIHGNKNPETDPIWATGWDHKSLLVGVRDNAQWTFFRLPKASHTYDGSHGWNTEWPRIRNIGTHEKPDYLMTMHGMFWQFPQSFSSANSAGIKPRSAYLKVIGDFTRWQNRLVFGCDDSAQKEFLNKRKIKGGIEGPGQSNSNLWFTSTDMPDQLGPNTASGSVWIHEEVEANEISESFLFNGWQKRMAWIHNHGEQKVTLTFEIDSKGTGNWERLLSKDLKAGGSDHISFDQNLKAAWIRVKTDKNTIATVSFNYTDSRQFTDKSDETFKGLASASRQNYTGGLLYGLGDNRRKLGVLTGTFINKSMTYKGYYELDSLLNLVKKDDVKTANFIKDKFSIPKNVVSVDEASILIVDGKGRRWRLPKGSESFTEKTNSGSLRICREVATERDLLNVHGTFYELPAENADGFAKVRPIASHELAINDYASYRGLLVMTGIDDKAQNDQHIVRSADGKAQVWAGTIDDLWKLGKPTGYGGPLKNTKVKANTPSDSYLIGFYDQKTLQLSHNHKTNVEFTIEVDAIGHAPFVTYKKLTVEPNETLVFEFVGDFQARWIRFSTDVDCSATALLRYE